MTTETATDETEHDLFLDWKGETYVQHHQRYVIFPSTAARTDRGTRYLTRPGLVLLAQTRIERPLLADFLRSFEDPDFEDYLSDPASAALSHGESLAKIAGQLCYLSFGAARTKDDAAADYFANIRAQRHGSVLEHTSFSFLAWGVSRSLTHELVRHRLAAYSQVSQRYVGPKALRFVERPEFSRDPELHGAFCDRIDATRRVYEALNAKLLDPQHSPPAEARSDRTARLKRTRQVARAVLPNETEAPLLFTMNARALRHVLEMRCGSGAEPEIRALFLRVFLALSRAAPTLFADYSLAPHPDADDPIGFILNTATPKV